MLLTLSCFGINIGMMSYDVLVRGTNPVLTLILQLIKLQIFVHFYFSGIFLAGLLLLPILARVSGRYCTHILVLIKIHSYHAPVWLYWIRLYIA